MAGQPLQQRQRRAYVMLIVVAIVAATVAYWRVPLQDRIRVAVYDPAVRVDAWRRQQIKAVRETLGPPLRTIQQPVDQWLGSLPMWVAVACTMALYGVAVAWVWTLRREFVFRGAPDQKRWRDLRLWATIVVLPYVALYLALGR